MSAEQWKPIPGYPNYDASDRGRIRSRQRRWRSGVPLILKLHRSPQAPGYMEVALRVSGRRKGQKVHKLVSAAFLGPRPDGLVTRHLDGDPTNNTLSNLTYGTQAENNRDKVRHGTSRWADRDYCKHGHPLTEENVRKRADSDSVRCLICQRAASRASYERQLARRAGCVA